MQKKPIKFSYPKKATIVNHKPYNSRSLSPNKKAKKFQKDPFSVSKKPMSSFGYFYSAGGIPCRLDFSGAKMKLKWQTPLEQLNYDPILETCFEGLIETQHPYKFIARECITQMIAAEDSFEKIYPLLSKLLIRLRKALECDIEDVFLFSMDVLKMLSDLFKDKLNQYLFLVLQPINKRSFKLKYKEKVFNLLRDLENNGGSDAYLIIKSKIPTYTTTI